VNPGDPERPTGEGDLAPIQEGVLDEEALEALQRDLRALAQITEVRLKDAPRAHSPDLHVSLEQALAALRTGRARGVQIRYRYGGEDWCDTLIRRDAGVSIVRVRAPGAG